MAGERSLVDAWNSLPGGARMAFEQQWLGLAAGGLPCGAAILTADGSVLTSGRNHAHDPPGSLESRAEYPLQHTRLAHAELNAVALVPTDSDHATLTLWTTQHPCAMCAAALRFIGMGKVVYVADDPSDHAAPADIAATHSEIPYQAMGDPLWWTVSNLLFLYNSAIQQREAARNLRTNRDRYPELVRLALDVARRDGLGQAARSGTPLPLALAPYTAAIRRCALVAPMQSRSG